MSLVDQLNAQMRLPVIGSPMFILSNPDLVIAQCMSGIVGSFPALNARPAEELPVWLERITTTLDEARAADPQAKIAPFAVNQIVHASNDRLEHDLKACADFKVPLMITSLRAPHEHLLFLPEGASRAEEARFSSERGWASYCSSARVSATRN